MMDNPLIGIGALLLVVLGRVVPESLLLRELLRVRLGAM